ncbi:MAG: sulfatase-like hydrolase/transferase, partial [Nanoarchaeota archaeon]
MIKLPKILNKFSKNIFRAKPNVIMIMIDGARCDSIGKIPFYENLKRESVFFSQVITYAPYTIASLHAIFSGIYGNKNGVNGYYRSFSFDKQNCTTLAEYLKSAGYHTECDLIRENVVPYQGFDKIHVYDEFKDDLTKRHSEILTQIKPKQPFFLFLDYSHIHTNLVKNVIKKYSDFDEEYFKKKDENLKNYLKWLAESGEYAKALLSKIKDLGLFDDSIIIVLSDHGTSVGDKIGEKNYGVFLHDYTIRCFLYIMWKKIPKNKEIKSLVRSIDIMPTLLDMLKLKERNSGKKMQGKSFLPFIDGFMDERIAYSETGGLGGPTPSPDKHNIKSIRTET